MASPEPVVRLAEGGSGEPPGTVAAGPHFRLPMNSASTSMASLLGLLASPDQGPAIHSTSNIKAAMEKERSLVLEQLCNEADLNACPVS